MGKIDSFEFAAHLSERIVKAEREGSSPRIFSQNFSYIHYGFSFREITPQMWRAKLFKKSLALLIVLKPAQGPMNVIHRRNE